MRRLHRLVPGGLALFAAAACGGGGDGNGGTGPSGGGGAVSARIDGQAWTSDAGRVQVTAGSSTVPGSLTITASKVASSTEYVTLTLSLAFIEGPGTYPLGVNIGSTAGGTGSVFETSGANVRIRLTPLSGSAGSLTVTSLTATRIKGTFTFVAEPTIGSALVGNRTVTDGSFDIPLPSGFTAVPAANHGSSVRATIGGTQWTGATVVGLGSAGAYAFGGTTTSLSVQFVTTTPVTTPGTFNLLSGVKLTISELGTTHSWGGFSDDVGTVTFTSVANGRVVGTFSGILQPLGTTPGTLSVTGGTFDVRINPAN